MHCPGHHDWIRLVIMVPTSSALICQDFFVICIFDIFDNCIHNVIFVTIYLNLSLLGLVYNRSGE